jgi:hypothetical protein
MQTTTTKTVLRSENDPNQISEVGLGWQSRHD